ncbi:hypothetical protein ACJX0J_013613, partial [Zea mays]
MEGMLALVVNRAKWEGLVSWYNDALQEVNGTYRVDSIEFGHVYVVENREILIFGPVIGTPICIRSGRAHFGNLFVLEAINLVWRLKIPTPKKRWEGNKNTCFRLRGLIMAGVATICWALCGADPHMRIERLEGQGDAYEERDLETYQGQT